MDERAHERWNDGTNEGTNGTCHWRLCNLVGRPVPHSKNLGPVAMVGLVLVVSPCPPPSSARTEYEYLVLVGRDRALGRAGNRTVRGPIALCAALFGVSPVVSVTVAVGSPSSVPRRQRAAVRSLMKGGKREGNIDWRPKRSRSLQSIVHRCVLRGQRASRSLLSRVALHVDSQIPSAGARALHLLRLKSEVGPTYRAGGGCWPRLLVAGPGGRRLGRTRLIHQPSPPRASAV